MTSIYLNRLSDETPHKQLSDRLEMLVNKKNQITEASLTRDLSQSEIEDLEDLFHEIDQIEDLIIIEENKLQQCSFCSHGCNRCLGLSY